MQIYKVSVTICETVLREGWVSVEATSEAVTIELQLAAEREASSIASSGRSRTPTLRKRRTKP